MDLLVTRTAEQKWIPISEISTRIAEKWKPPKCEHQNKTQFFVCVQSLQTSIWLSFFAETETFQCLCFWVTKSKLSCNKCLFLRLFKSFWFFDSWNVFVFLSFWFFDSWNVLKVLLVSEKLLDLGQKFSLHWIWDKGPTFRSELSHLKIIH
jgi:hypothetical protein